MAKDSIEKRMEELEKRVEANEGKIQTVMTVFFNAATKVSEGVNDIVSANKNKLKDEKTQKVLWNVIIHAFSRLNG